MINFQDGLLERRGQRDQEVARRGRSGGETRSVRRFEFFSRVEAEQLDDDAPTGFGWKARVDWNLELREENLNRSRKSFF